MHILITGGDSTLARSLAAALIADGSTVRLFDRTFSATSTANIEQASGDPCDPDTLDSAMAGVYAILHLAPYLPGREREVADLQAIDDATRGTFVLANAARKAGVQRIILASTLDLFDRLPAHYNVNEAWRPRPTPETSQLSPWLAELSIREHTRVGGFDAVCLRLGRIMDDAQASAQAYDPRWVHISDVIQAFQLALRFRPAYTPAWSLFHVMAAGPHAKIQLEYAASAADEFGYKPAYDFKDRWPADPRSIVKRDTRPWREILAPRQMPSRPIHRVLILGAGGPMGAVTTQELSSSYTLRITDVRPIKDIAADNKPQAPGAPLPIPLGEPHETITVDVRDPAQVMAAAEGMDAIINCTVVRPDPVNAFLVNTIGAYNVMRAAIAHNIRRVVHTGPLVQFLTGIGDHSGDYDLHVDAPPRPYDHLYIHSKYLGTEICRA